jgi:predicted heme/steroid binding protein
MQGNENKSKIGLIVSIVIAIAFVAAAVTWAMNSSKQQKGVSIQPGTSGTAEQSGSNKSISKAELAAADGKDGSDCFVAVDGTVYEIKDSSLWQNGQHTPSNGEGYCGADMSAAINQSPHGKSKLEQLNEVGRLE